MLKKLAIRDKRNQNPKFFTLRSRKILVRLKFFHLINFHCCANDSREILQINRRKLRWCKFFLDFFFASLTFFVAFIVARRVLRWCFMTNRNIVSATNTKLLNGTDLGACVKAISSFTCEVFFVSENQFYETIHIFPVCF